MERCRGFAFTFGVFQEYYEDHPAFAGASNIATVGTTQSVCSSRVLAAHTLLADTRVAQGIIYSTSA